MTGAEPFEEGKVRLTKRRDLWRLLGLLARLGILGRHLVEVLRRRGVDVGEVSRGAPAPRGT